MASETSRWRGLGERLFGPSTESLPPRVRAAVLRQRDASERLIAWSRLAVVLLFGTLWTISPKTAMGEGALAVPLALLLYLALTLIWLLWSHRGRLPAWAAGVSTCCDMLLLLAVIWSFHLAYDQPPSFYLKAPTLLYVFIFMALSALRFDARYLLLSGLTAALGWGAMVLYVVLAEPGDPMITRDYVAYLTGNAILVGAEFDKIVSILTVTFILALAIGRARALLLRSVAEGLAARDLSRFFDLDVAERITAGGNIAAGQGERRDAAILAIDLRGFTQLTAARPPEEVVELLADYQARLLPAVRRHGGAVDKFIGDGILCSFGAVTPSTTYARDGFAALLEVLAEGRAWQAERQAQGLPAPAVNAALSAGRVLFAVVGVESRLEYTVIGEPVNLAVKLEKHNKLLGSRGLADSAALTLALAQGLHPPPTHRRRPGQRLPGVDAPLDLVEVTDV